MVFRILTNEKEGRQLITGESKICVKKVSEEGLYYNGFEGRMRNFVYNAFFRQAMFYPSKIALCRFDLAEGVGFEPTDTFVSPVFKTGAFGRSATPPQFIVII